MWYVWHLRTNHNSGFKADCSLLEIGGVIGNFILDVEYFYGNQTTSTTTHSYSGVAIVATVSPESRAKTVVDRLNCTIHNKAQEGVTAEFGSIVLQKSSFKTRLQ